MKRKVELKGWVGYYVRSIVVVVVFNSVALEYRYSYFMEPSSVSYISFEYAPLFTSHQLNDSNSILTREMEVPEKGDPGGFAFWSVISRFY